MERHALVYLEEWKTRPTRKPLIIRGARQVGKSYLVENFAARHYPYFLKIDFEESPEWISLFQSRDLDQILHQLSITLQVPIIEHQTLIFIDEIQNCPDAIVLLRYFYEQHPNIHVLAAGSLLEFALAEFSYSMPVGRIEFMYLYPFSFDEYLQTQNPQLAQFLQQWSLSQEIPPLFHKHLLNHLREYYFIGGMPEAIQGFLSTHSYLEVQRIQQSLVSTIQQDFGKYASRSQQIHLQHLLHFIPKNLGNKVRYHQINSDVPSRTLKQAIAQLTMAQIAHPIRHTSANGIPLKAEESDKRYKLLMLDIGIANRLLGLELATPETLMTIHEGALAEQFIGQQLLTLFHDFEPATLHYWLREQKNANAEVDYLLIHQNQLIPVEVKAGKSGRLKSVHVFLHEKQRSLAVRFNASLPEFQQEATQVRVSKNVESVDYQLLSLPLYLSGHLKRILSKEER